MADVGGLLRFLDDSPSPVHAVSTAASLLAPDGFGIRDLRSAGPAHFASPKGVVSVAGALVAWSWPETADPDNGALLVGAHTDSPCLRLKPRPNSRGAGLSVLETEIYGGVLLNSWLDRDLGLAGVVHDRNGGSSLFVIRRPVARIPQLAIHLDRDVNEKGLLLNRQTHMRPIWAVGDRDILDLVSESARVQRSEVVSFDAVFFDVNPAAVVGASGEFIASGRLDNLVSCWAAIEAIRVHDGPMPMITCLFDHEEVGSESTTGAAGPLLERTIVELLRARGGSESTFAFFNGSLCISADNAHALHPNHPERHDPNHAPLINHGPALKVNANQRYATSGRGASILKRVAIDAGLPLQEFVSNNTMPCGSTIGPITATRLGIETVDIGVPQFAMHSARETCGASDPLVLRDLLRTLGVMPRFG